MNKDDWGGVAIEESAADDWGGVLVLEKTNPLKDDWGGEEIRDEEPTPPSVKSINSWRDVEAAFNPDSVFETDKQESESGRSIAARLPSGIASASFDAAAAGAKTADDLITISSQDSAQAEADRFRDDALAKIGTPEGTASYQEYMRRRKEAADKSGQPTALNGVVEDMRDLSERSADDYGVDRTYDYTLRSKVIAGVGSVIPAIAAGPLAPVAGGAMLGESFRKDAEQSGGTEQQQTVAFYAGAGTGVISEALLGVPALLRSVKAAGASPTTIKQIAMETLGQGLKSAGREGAQEFIENTAQNLTASTLADYDVDRDAFKGGLEAFVIGALVGGPVGASVQAAASTKALVDQKQIDSQIDGEIQKMANEAPPEPAVETLSPEKQADGPPALPSTGEPIEPGAGGGQVEPTASTDSAYVTSPEIQSLLAEEPVADEGPGLKPIKSEMESEGGGIFTTRGGKTRPAGVTPKGFRDDLIIPSVGARFLRVLEGRGVRAMLQSVKNPVGRALGKQTRVHVDMEQELTGKSVAPFERAQKGMKRSEINAAFDEASAYIREKETGGTVPTLSPNAQKILNAWQTVADESGSVMQANNVQVFDSKINGYRPARKIGRDYIPRMFTREVEKALSNPQGNAELFNELAQSIATHRGVTLDDAAAELRRVAGRFSGNDFVGNLELARGEQLPPIFYEYDLRNLAARYIPSYAERMSQIIAFGQRLGPRESPIKPNLWDVARWEADTRTQEWLNEAEDVAVNFKPKSEFSKWGRRLQTLATGSLLSDPTTTVPRNIISGLISPTELFGVARSLKGVLDVVKNSDTRRMAREIGAVRDNLGSYLHADQVSGSDFIDEAFSFVTDKALKLSGNTASEVFVRSHSGAVANQFLKDGVAAINKNPSSSLSKEALGMFKRWNIDAEKVVSEGGNWETGTESRKFIRTAIREMQGGYRYDQVPLWAQSALGRVFYQYGRWGTQRAQHLFENIIQPIRGQEVEWHGKKMVNRKFAPLIRAGIAAIAVGELYAILTNALFGRERKDSSFAEMSQAWTEDKMRAVELAAMRALNDLIAGGQLGILSQPIDAAVSIKDKSRFKNPLDPPSFAAIKALTELALNAKDQGTVTDRDLMRFAGQVVRGPKNVSEVGRNVFDEPLFEARKDAGNLRSAIKRWEKIKGQDLSPRGASRKTKNSPAYEAIEDALLVGDVEKARELTRAFTADWKNNKSESPKDAKRKLKSAIRSRQPFRSADNDKENKRAFFTWAQKNLSKDDFNAIKRVQDRYEATAKRVGY